MTCPAPTFLSWLVSLSVGGFVAPVVAQQFPHDVPPVPPAAPAPIVSEGEESWEDTLAALRRRVDELEQAEADRDKADAKRKAAEDDKKAAAAKAPTLHWTGQLQADFYAFDQDAASVEEYGDIDNGEAFRRARFGMFGDYGPSEYRIEMDFALAGRPSFLDVWAGLKDIPHVGRIRVGHFFEPFSLERLTANRFVTFMERSLSDQAFVPARNTGLMIGNTYLEERGTWAVGVFRSDSDAFGDEVGDEFETALTGRLTYLPWYDDADGSRYLHLGLGYSLRDTNGDQVRFRAQPEARLGSATPNVPYLVDTGNVPAESFQLVGLEAAWVHGPFSISSEYFLVPVNAVGPDGLFFHGAYAQAGYFLTGEHRPYRRQAGTFDRVIPRRDFLRYHGEPKEKCLELGPGAWEIAGRVSGLDLDDEFVQGGSIVDLTLGLNWYLNPYLRITANWVRAYADRDSVESRTDALGMRVGYDF